MFVANKELRATYKGKVVIYKEGDEIPDFDTWNIHAQRANLNMNWVKKIDPEEAKALKAVAQKAAAGKTVKKGSVKKAEPKKKAAPQKKAKPKAKAEKPMEKVKPAKVETSIADEPDNGDHAAEE